MWLKNSILATTIAFFLIDISQAAYSPLKLDFEVQQGERQVKKTKFRYPTLVKRDGSSTPQEISLPNEQSYYLANLTMGTPGQKIGVLIDTGSSDLWVQSSKNPYCAKPKAKRDESPYQSLYSSFESYLTDAPPPTETETETDPYAFVTQISTSTIEATQECLALGEFNPDSSDTYHDNHTEFGITYGDSTYAYGTWGYDKVTIGNLTVDLSFGLANMSNSTQGVLGIGYPGLESSNIEYLNLPAKLAADGLIPKALYSLFLNNHDETGSILFGAVDHSKYSGSLYTLPIINEYAAEGLTQPIEMLITLSEGSVNGKSFSEDKYAVLLDSGTTYSTAPTELFEAVNDAIGAKYDENLESYVTQCYKSDFNITWNFSGAKIVVPGASYLAEILDADNNVITDKDGQDLCVSTIMESSGNPIFGDNFLRNAYIVYDLDLNQISIGQANYDDSNEDIEVVSSTVPSAVTASAYSETWSADSSSYPTENPPTDTYQITETVGFQSTVQWDTVTSGQSAAKSSSKSSSSSSVKAGSSKSSDNSSSTTKSSGGVILSNDMALWNTVIGCCVAISMLFAL